MGEGPFPTELFDDMGIYLAEKGGEVGATTGRPRRCGWLDAVLLSHTVRLNGVDGLCVTKIDVLDGLETVKNLHRLQQRTFNGRDVRVDDLRRC